MSEKIQKALAALGIGSRRGIEEHIRAGRITVNGQPAVLGMRISPAERVALDGRVISTDLAVQKTHIILYHKPVSQICTRKDIKQRPLVFSDLPILDQGRWISVGRLDINTSGLLLFTNNGMLANALMHPRYQFEREYIVRVFGVLKPEKISALTESVLLEEGPARFEDVVYSRSSGDNHWFYVLVKEGRNRLVRRLWASQGLQVTRLKRVRFGPIFLNAALRPGSWRELEKQEWKELSDRLVPDLKTLSVYPVEGAQRVLEQNNRHKRGRKNRRI